MNTGRQYDRKQLNQMAGNKTPPHYRFRLHIPVSRAEAHSSVGSRFSGVALAMRLKEVV